MQKIDINKLKFYLSHERLDKYVSLSNGKVKDAILSYRKDLQYCQKFYIILNLLEIILRNTINYHVSQPYGNDWYDSDKINFNEKQKNIIDEAKIDILKEKKVINNPTVITGLTFGFWCNLFNSEHDNTLWRICLYKIFTNLEKPPKRSKTRDYSQKFRKIRNRVSHCECIVQYPLDKYYNNLIEFLNWIDADVAKWIEKETGF